MLRAPWVRRLLGVLVVLCSASTGLLAADQWIEVTSPHFTVMSNAGERSTRRLAWQLEQVRSATAALWSWARPDLNKPLVVIAVKDESSLRALAPEYWETRGTVRPASVWVTGPDRHYLAIRTDIQLESQGTLNPYLTAYASYVNLVLRQSVGRDLPLWFSQGLTEVLANTIVRDDDILIGPPISWNLQILRERPTMPLAKLLAVTRTSPEYLRSDARETFDAETWALVHFLMFGEEGTRSAALNAYSKLVSAGKDPGTSFAETLGPVDALEGPFRIYVQRRIFSYRRAALDVGVERERLPVRPLTPGEAWSARSMFYAVTGRAVEAHAAIAEARKADAQAADSYTAEALVLDRDDKDDEARAAYGKAADLGTSNAFVHYRLATMLWQPSPSSDTLAAIKRHLLKAVELNPRYADAYAWLGELRAFAGDAEAMGLIRRAINLEPRESSHYVHAAAALLAGRKVDDAEIAARNAMTLADTDGERQQAQRMLDAIGRARSSGR